MRPWPQALFKCFCFLLMCRHRWRAALSWVQRRSCHLLSVSHLCHPLPTPPETEDTGPCSGLRPGATAGRELCLLPTLMSLSSRSLTSAYFVSCTFYLLTSTMTMGPMFSTISLDPAADFDHHLRVVLSLQSKFKGSLHLRVMRLYTAQPLFPFLL